MRKVIYLLMIQSVFLTSCCTLLSDPTRRVTVTAQQSDAEVIIDGYDCGRTPLSVDLDKTRDHTIIVSKPGFQPQQTNVRSHHTIRSASNFLFAPAVGAGVGTVIGLTTNDLLFGAILGCGVGAAVGLGVGLIGSGYDVYSRSDCELDKQHVHFNLRGE